jgi:hypothetical protein
LVVVQAEVEERELLLLVIVQTLNSNARIIDNCGFIEVRNID